MELAPKLVPVPPLPAFFAHSNPTQAPKGIQGPQVCDLGPWSRHCSPLLCAAVPPPLAPLGSVWSLPPESANPLSQTPVSIRITPLGPYTAYATSPNRIFLPLSLVRTTATLSKTSPRPLSSLEASVGKISSLSTTPLTADLNALQVRPRPRETIRRRLPLSNQD